MHMGEFFALAVFIAQQLGVMLGVGAGTVLLVAYLLGLHKEESDAAHQNFVRAVFLARSVALGVIVVSGVAAVGVHFAVGELGVLFAPAFVFKWILIGAVLGLYFVEKWAQGLSSGWRLAVCGFVGAQWYALFLIHSVAPVTTWEYLLPFYAGWVVFFELVWHTFVWVMSRPLRVQKVAEAKTSSASAVPEKPPAPPPVFVKPASPIVLPVPKPTEHHNVPEIAPVILPVVVAVPAPMPQPKPAPAPTLTDIEKEPDLPAIRVMPRTPEEIKNQNRASVVKFE